MCIIITGIQKLVQNIRRCCKKDSRNEVKCDKGNIKVVLL